MKRCILYLSLGLIILIASCSAIRYNRGYRYDDEFRGGVRNYIRLSIKPEERRTEIGVARVIIEKEIKGSLENVKAYFVVSRTPSSFKSEKTGYMKVGDHKFELSIEDPVSELRTKSEATMSGFSRSDSTGVESKQSADIETRVWNEDKFILNLSGEIVSEVLKAREVIFRFYFGPIPVTYRITGSTLEELQEALK
jgi:hypothetical protein